MMKYILLAAIVSFLAVPAQAQPGAPENTAEELFANMDIDKDGKITDKDVEARGLELQKAKNADPKDVAARGEKIKAHFKSMDTDKDDGVSFAEYKAYRENWKKEADTDKDGVISREERGAMAAKHNL